MIFNNLIFIHIPKTAGSSLINSLKKNYKLLEKGDSKFIKKNKLSVKKKYTKYNIPLIEFEHHLPFDVLKKSVEFKKKPIITFVRNPFSRAVSLFHECLSEKKYRNILKINDKTSFHSFLNIIKKKKFWFTMPMIDWIGIDNLKEMKFIGKYENLSSDIKIIKKRYNLNFDLKYHNRNSVIKRKIFQPNYIEFYKDEDIIKKVELIYKKDLATFNYNFEKFKKFEKNKNKFFNLIKNYIYRKI
jgi:hypothetical protein